MWCGLNDKNAVYWQVAQIKLLRKPIRCPAVLGDDGHASTAVVSARRTAAGAAKQTGAACDFYPLGPAPGQQFAAGCRPGNQRGNHLLLNNSFL
jgi:hypothetical protein